MTTRGAWAPVGTVGVTVSVTACPVVGLAGDTDNATLAVVPTVTVTLLSLPPALAVTSAVRVVLSVTRASPLESVFAVCAERVPAVVLNVTGTSLMRLPDASIAEATIVAVPPVDGRLDGEAVTVTAFVAAPPIRISSTLVGVVPVPPVAPPDVARICAVPDAE